MNKVICDVCGTDYPETAAQCPICGCATAGGQTSVGNAASGDEELSTYTYVKGGRFSKSNVRKRLKASQLQESRIVEPDPEDLDDEDEDEELDQEEETSNRGLVVVVILLILAIVAVASYIAFSIFGVGQSEETTPVTQQPVTTVTTGEAVDQIPCTSLVLRDLEVHLQSEGDSWQLTCTVEPANTTDAMSFVSSDETVATVHPTSGLVTAVGNGNAVITVKCGEVSVDCPVVCEFKQEQTEPSTDPTATEGTEPTDETVVTEPTEETTTTEPVEDFVLKLKRSDFTMFTAGETYALYNGKVDAAQITWTSDDEAVATVKNGVVTAVGPGSTRINAEYNGQKAVCWVRCRIEVEDATETTEPTDTTETTTETETTAPTEGTTGQYVLRKNGAKCTYGDDYNAHATIKVGESFKLAVVDGENNAQNVTWSVSKEGVCSISGTKITGTASGTVTLTVTYEGQTFTCVIIVR